MVNPLPNGSAVVPPRTPNLREREREARPAGVKGENRARRRRGEDHPSLPPLPDNTQSPVFLDCQIFLYSMFISAFYLD